MAMTPEAGDVDAGRSYLRQEGKFGVAPEMVSKRIREGGTNRTTLRGMDLRKAAKSKKDKLIAVAVLTLFAGAFACAFLLVQSPSTPHSASVSSLLGPSWIGEGNQADARFGYSAAPAGDVNSDGYDDIIVGALKYTIGEANEGCAFLYLGSSSGLSASPAWIGQGNQASAFYGSSVSSAGDVNNDGYDDVVVGAMYYDNPDSNEGRAFLYLGSSSGLSSSPAWIAESDQAGAFFGDCVSSAGDVNGDGYDDVVVNAILYDNGETDEGRVYLYLGNSMGLSSVPAWTAEGNQASARFGESVTSAGDVNGDGYDDVILGVTEYDNGETNEGRVCVYFGSSSGLPASPSWTVEANQAFAVLGVSVSSAGDVNNDGYDDIIAGAIGYDLGETDEGTVSLYLGSASGLPSSPSWVAEGNLAGLGFGNSVSSAGDVNSDGCDDIVIGAPLYDGSEINEGRAYLYSGSPSEMASSPTWIAEGDQAQAYFGDSVASAGDVNGDGCDDVIVAAPQYDNSETDEGRVYVYSGVMIPEFKALLLPVIGAVAIILALRRTHVKK